MDLKFVGILLISVFSHVNSQGPNRVCASLSQQLDCRELQKGSSAVHCIYVQDAVECAQRIINGTADFGVFTAENAFHIASMRWPGLAVIKELRHTSKAREPFDYQSVAIVRAEHEGGKGNLKGTDFCHPGLHQHQRHERWTEGFLKFFERQTVPNDCEAGTTPAEIEAASLAGFFNAACRPGLWSFIESEDEALKKKYSKLCELCDNVETCSYEASSATSHQQALECMKKSTNPVAYVALTEAQEFFTANADIINDYKYLCPNSSYQNIANNENPCVWSTQPWSMIVSNNENALTLSLNIQRWAQMGRSDWESAITSLLSSGGTNTIYILQNIVPLVDYVNTIRPILAPVEMCRTTATWCTHSYDEREKCDILKTVAFTLGIFPLIECGNPRTNAVSCLSDVNTGKADLVGIDSNFGFLARHVYNLTTALYEETDIEKYSSVVAVIKEKDTERIKSFEDFQEKRACFAEFGGIAAISFINAAKNRGIFKREDCNFGQLLGNYFSDSCLPGSRSVFHDPNISNPENLCALCQTQLYLTTTTTSTTTVRTQQFRGAVGNDDDDDVPQDDLDYDEGSKELSSTPDGIEGLEETIPFVPNRAVNCAASPSNRFYGTRGALTCLNEVGEVAILEHQRLAEHARALNLNPEDFRILCRNGSLANAPGFDVDQNCFMTTIVDGEIVVKRNNPKNPGIVNALLSLDQYLKVDPDFKLYSVFNGEKDLLFEDSAIGLVSPDNTDEHSPSVQNYIRLFQDVENCISETSENGATTTSHAIITSNLLFSFALILFIGWPTAQF